MVITGNDEEEISDLKGKLSAEFDMKDLGNLKYFLGIEVIRSKGVSLSAKESIFWICWPKLECLIVNQQILLS